MTIKRLILRAFFSIEIVLFSWVYLYGASGLDHLLILQKENNLLLHETQTLQQNIARLELDIKQWNAHPFYKEKIAREQLQMIRKNERIYYIT